MSAKNSAMKLFFRIFILFLVALIGHSAVEAQSLEPDQLLLVSLAPEDYSVVGRDLYTYTDGEWLPITSGGYKGGFSLSPDSEWVAFLSVPEILKTADLNGRLMQSQNSSDLLNTVWDIRLLQLETGEQREIAVQHADFDFLNDNLQHGISRSLPIWSPDGTALAWTEMDWPFEGHARLVTYSLNTGETHILEEELPLINLSASGFPNILKWGDPGIAVFGNDPDFDNEGMFRLYNLDAGARQIIRISEEGYSGIFYIYTPDIEANLWTNVHEIGREWIPDSLFWVTDGSDEVLVFNIESMDGMDRNNIWLRADPMTGATYIFNNQLDFMSETIVDASLRLAWDLAADDDMTEWSLFSPEEELLKPWKTNMFSGRFVFSPSGQSLIYWDDETGNYRLIEDGESEAFVNIPNNLRIGQILWGGTRAVFGSETETYVPVPCDASGCG